MLIYEIFHKTAVNEAFPVKGMAAKPEAAQPKIKQPAKPGFFRNAAEFAAAAAMRGIGMSDADMRDLDWARGGHMATLMGRGTASLAQAENHMAERLAREWVHSQTIAGSRPKRIRNVTMYGQQVPVPEPAEVAKAIALMNQAGQRLPINVKQASKQFVKFIANANKNATKSPSSPAATTSSAMTQMVNQLTKPTTTAKPRIQRLPGETVQAAIKRAQQGQTTARGATPSTGMFYPGGQPILPTDPVYAALKRQGKI